MEKVFSSAILLRRSIFLQLCGLYNVWAVCFMRSYQSYFSSEFEIHQQPSYMHLKLFLKIVKTITGSCTIVSNRTPTWREDASLKSHELEKYYHGTTFRSAVNKNSKNHENSNFSTKIFEMSSQKLFLSKESKENWRFHFLNFLTYLKLSLKISA